MLFYFLLLGSFAGFVAGLLGVGGGLIIVPALVIIFQTQGFSDSTLVHMAVGTSLGSIVFTSVSSVWAHNKKGSVLWRTVFALSPGILVGAMLGSALADSLPTVTLRFVFGCFELFVAIQMTLNIKPKPHRTLPDGYGSTAVGTVIGAASTVVGIGGGTLTVPFLSWCNISMRQAVATSAACGFPIAVSGAIGFVIAGWNEANLRDFSVGYIYLPALIGIVSTSVLLAPLGAKMAHSLPVNRLKQIFAVLLYVLAARMLIA